MSTTALYDALLEAGASRETAKDAAEGLANVNQVATKADLANLEARLTWRIMSGIGIILAAIAVLGAFLALVE